ncbi:Hypothetical_protein [Hexamita inflata]|uniref:Hypothetical_protein n=1 Tax=Hexamita inflata TaxID=28002 RepID=A0AA86NPX0_9EUKA|nr:Hypothetical protein HINF_LOCUS11029 [Hexamita inflata]
MKPPALLSNRILTGKSHMPQIPAIQKRSTSEIVPVPPCQQRPYAFLVNLLVREILQQQQISFYQFQDLCGQLKSCPLSQILVLTNPQLLTKQSELLQISDSQIKFDVSGFIQKRPSSTSQQISSFNPELVFGDSVSTPKVTVNEQFITVQERKFYSFYTNELVGVETQYLHLGQNKLKYFEDDLLFVICKQILKDTKGFDQNKIIIEFDCGIDTEEIFKQQQELIELFELKFNSRPNLVLNLDKISFKSNTIQIQSSIVQLIQNLILNSNLFTHNTVSSFPIAYKDLIQTFNTYIRSDINQNFAFALITKQQTVSSRSSSSQETTTDIDELLNELQCDYTVDGDSIELQFDMDYYISEYKKQLLLLEKMIKKEDEIFAGGICCTGALEKELFKILGEIGVEKVGKE